MAEEIHYVNIGIQKALHERAVEHSKRLGIESFAGFVRFFNHPRTNIRGERQMKNLYKALLQVQSQVVTLPKTKKSKNGVFTPLDVIMDFLRPKLKEAGLVLLQTVEDVNGAVAVKTTVIHAESGESVENIAVAPKERGQIFMSPVQAMGADITYLRRYSVSPIFGITSDEDVDADYLDKSKPQKQAPKEPSPADLSKFLSYADTEANKATDAEVFSRLRGEAEQAFGKPLPKEISSHLMELYTKFTQKSEVKGE